MSEFWKYFIFGFKHLWSFHVYIDILFLWVLTVSYDFKVWKKILLLLFLFTVGHTLALMLTIFNVITIKTNIVSFIIHTLIFILALYTIISTGKLGKKDNMTFIAIVSSVFGIIHGLGFANYFNTIVLGKPTDRLLPLFESVLGFGVSQILMVVLSLLFAYMVQTLLKFSKRDWILIVCAFVVGIVVPMIIRNQIWQH